MMSKELSPTMIMSIERDILEIIAENPGKPWRSFLRWVAGNPHVNKWQYFELLKRFNHGDHQSEAINQRIYHPDCVAADLKQFSFGETREECVKHLAKTRSNDFCCIFHYALVENSRIGIPDAIEHGLLDPVTELINVNAVKLSDTCRDWNQLDPHQKNRIAASHKFSSDELTCWRQLDLDLDRLAFNRYLTPEQQIWLQSQSET